MTKFVQTTTKPKQLFFDIKARDRDHISGRFISTRRDFRTYNPLYWDDNTPDEIIDICFTYDGTQQFNSEEFGYFYNQPQNQNTKTNTKPTIVSIPTIFAENLVDTDDELVNTDNETISNTLNPIPIKSLGPFMPIKVNINLKNVMTCNDMESFFKAEPAYFATLLRLKWKLSQSSKFKVHIRINSHGNPGKLLVIKTINGKICDYSIGSQEISTFCEYTFNMLKTQIQHPGYNYVNCLQNLDFLTIIVAACYAAPPPL